MRRLPTGVDGRFYTGLVLLHIGHTVQDAAESRLVLFGLMTGGAGLGLLIAFSREIRSFAYKRRHRLDRGDDSA